MSLALARLLFMATPKLSKVFLNIEKLSRVKGAPGVIFSMAKPQKLLSSPDAAEVAAWREFLAKISSLPKK